LSAVIPKIQAAIATIPLPAGYSLTLGGQYVEQRVAFAEFAEVLAVALTLVVLVLVATFESFRLPAVVLATVPLAPLGATLALLATGTPVNVASFMGALLLVGIVVRNGILLVDSANRQRATGANVRDSLLAAGSERLRPILMTAFATVGGLAPLAIGFGAGSEMERPLAITVIGGLAFATACSLVVVPVLYAVLARNAEQSASSRSA
ncbi:MAG TPA: efflux RND transporter permease subunit, partial [Candidatus Baltobacteraceae bacterium]